jgi:hypothetical protein
VIEPSELAVGAIQMSDKKPTMVGNRCQALAAALGPRKDYNKDRV